MLMLGLELSYESWGTYMQEVGSTPLFLGIRAPSQLLHAMIRRATAHGPCEAPWKLWQYGTDGFLNGDLSTGPLFSRDAYLPLGGSIEKILRLFHDSVIWLVTSGVIWAVVGGAIAPPKKNLAPPRKREGEQKKKHEKKIRQKKIQKIF